MAGIATKGSRLFIKDVLPFLLVDAIANLTKIGAVGPKADVKDVTDLDSGDYKEYIPTLKDADTIDIAGNFVGAAANFTRLQTLFDNGTTTNFGISNSSMTGANIGFKGFITEYKIAERTPDGFHNFTAKIQILGKPTAFAAPTT